VGLHSFAIKPRRAVSQGVAKRGHYCTPFCSVLMGLQGRPACARAARIFTALDEKPTRLKHENIAKDTV
jgi:hypothetical protein